MDRRLHDRTQVAFQVRVTLISNSAFSAEGEAIDMSRSGIGVSLPIQFPSGSLVQLDIADSVLYGFVAYARSLPPSASTSFARNKVWIGASESNEGGDGLPERSFYHTGIEVVEVLIGSSGLSQLLKTTFEETMPNVQMTYSGAAPEGK
jgi:hypothetical protein